MIRVFGVPDGALLYQFRRGTKPAAITSLAFNPAADLLCASSESETVHIFRLEVKAAAYVVSVRTQAQGVLPGLPLTAPPRAPRAKVAPPDAPCAPVAGPPLCRGC